jgi:hypothetical protein
MFAMRDRPLHATPAATLLDQLQATADPARLRLPTQEFDEQHRRNRRHALHRRVYRLEAVVPLPIRDLWLEILQGVNQASMATHNSLVVRPIGPKREHLFRVGSMLGEADGVVVVGINPHPGT